ncbi:hypothetical protein FHG87_010583 [Trinorchestia longiramus]|nr:hypothetical protein FHG87_010583 [Trinorchestia longiramus]
MFILPYLQTISGAMTQQIQLVKKDGVQSIDQIISEMLLGCFSEDEREEDHDTLTSPILRMIPPPSSRSRVRDFEDEQRPNDSLDRHRMRSPSSMEPCDLSYHPQQDVVNLNSDARGQNLSDAHHQPLTHFRQNGYSHHPHSNHVRTPAHDQNHIREYYIREPQPYVKNDGGQASDLEGMNKTNSGSVSDVVNGSYQTIGTHDSYNRKMYTMSTAENLTAVEVSRNYENQSHWNPSSTTLIDLSNSNMQSSVQDNRNSHSPLEIMEHSSFECMDTTPLDCSDRNHRERMHDSLGESRSHTHTQGRSQLIHHTSKVPSNGLLTPNNGVVNDPESSHHFMKESDFGVGSDVHSILNKASEPTEEVHGVMLMGPVRVDQYGSFESCNRSIERVQHSNRPVDCSSPHLPMNLRQRLSDR